MNALLRLKLMVIMKNADVVKNAKISVEITFKEVVSVTGNT